MEKYFRSLEAGARRCYELAGGARARGLDPESRVEMLVAQDLAARVEQLVGPPGIADRIRELSDRPREESAITIAREIVRGRFGRLPLIKAIEQGIRSGLALLTEGVLVAPMEGIAGVQVKRNANGTQYVAVSYAGPIRSAGGTEQAMSVLIADVVRREAGLDRYMPTKGEVERYKEEIPLYKRIAHLQYTPPPGEIELVVQNCPVCVDGEGTEQEEIAGNRDLPRVGTNRVRGGACLVIAEGLCLKAPKIQRVVERYGIEGWDWIKGIKRKNSGQQLGSRYLGDLIAGRPVFSYPGRAGGFRLRFGRCRNTGLAALSISPATMYLLGEFLAVGTQMKVEIPGKACAVTPCDQLEGPIVLLKNGDLVQANDVAAARNLSVESIVDVGQILIPYGEFRENNRALVPGDYTEEWWALEAQAAGLRDATIKDGQDAFSLSERYHIPLHPHYNLFWHDLTREDILSLSDYVLAHGRYNGGVLVIPRDDRIKRLLVVLGALHTEREGGLVIGRYGYAIIRCVGLDVADGRIVRSRTSPQNDTMPLVSELSGVLVMPRSPTRVGARMGRPEKAREREMTPPPHVLFPLGIAGGHQRLVGEAAKHGKISIDIGIRRCPQCGREGIAPRCACGAHTIWRKKERRNIGIRELYVEALAEMGIDDPPKIKGVWGMVSKEATPEAMAKGVLRAARGVHVFKDGTCRYDMTDVPLTHVRPSEIGTAVKRLRELGYTNDWRGEPLLSDDQIVELKPQDCVPSIKCGEHLVKVASFIDDELERFYGLLPFYHASRPQDLIGRLIVGLAPHTSAGVLGRIVGYTPASVCYAHPFFHAAKRRNCDGDEDAVMLLLDCLLNFSRAYTPEKRGGMMDTPLVLTTRIKPEEIDDEAHNLDLLSQYPLEFYRAAVRGADPREVEGLMDTVEGRIAHGHKYDRFGFTVDTRDISEGPPASSYKTLGAMSEKVGAQLELADKLRAVDQRDVASRVIEGHLLPDLLGNLRAFSKQSFRCTRCNAKYRRIPLSGRCQRCGSPLVLTVHEASVRKYLELANSIADEYDITPYIHQRLSLTEKAINSLFAAKPRECKLDDFF